MTAPSPNMLLEVKDVRVIYVILGFYTIEIDVYAVASDSHSDVTLESIIKGGNLWVRRFFECTVNNSNNITTMRVLTRSGYITIIVTMLQHGYRCFENCVNITIDSKDSIVVEESRTHRVF